MSNIAKGRVEYLQREIAEAIKRAYDIDTLSKGGVENIFGNLLRDPAIEMKLKRIQDEV